MRSLNMRFGIILHTSVCLILRVLNNISFKLKSQKGTEELCYCLTGQQVPKYKCRCHPPGSALNEASNPGRGLRGSYKIIWFVMPSPCDLHTLFQSSWYNISISRFMCASDDVLCMWFMTQHHMKETAPSSSLISTTSNSKP